MSARYFCDQCGDELKLSDNASAKRLLHTQGKIKTEVHVAVDGCWNAGHVCAKCVIATVSTGHRICP